MPKPEEAMCLGFVAHFGRALGRLDPTRPDVPDSFIAHTANETTGSMQWTLSRMGLGMVPGWPDYMAFWKTAYGPTICFLEAKKPGWKPGSDKRWREGTQPTVHRALRRLGFNVGIFRSVEEAEVLLVKFGAPLRFRIAGNRTELEEWQWSAGGA